MTLPAQQTARFGKPRSPAHTVTHLPHYPLPTHTTHTATHTAPAYAPRLACAVLIPVPQLSARCRGMPRLVKAGQTSPPSCWHTISCPVYQAFSQSIIRARFARAGLCLPYTVLKAIPQFPLDYPHTRTPTHHLPHTWPAHKPASVPGERGSLWRLSGLHPPSLRLDFIHVTSTTWKEGCHGGRR